MRRGTSRTRGFWAVGLGLALALGSACTGPKRTGDPRYRPAESILEVVALLRRHVPDDTYRFEPARDFTGRNVYRASLLRLENLERVHADALRAGTYTDVIHFAKGRALERIRGFSLAAEQYRAAAEGEGELTQEALRSAAINDALAEAANLEPGPELRSDETRTLASLDARKRLLEAVLADTGGSHYAFVIQEEIERTDEARSEYVVDRRALSEDGDLHALSALQQLVSSHRESKNTNRHLLALADLYAELSMEYVEAHPPESLSFDPPRFEELVEAAARLYEAISNQDGAPEKLEASRRLEAFLAFTLQVDRDRFSP
ncbi:MAG: hypothetical protein QNK05_11415 [Myxococcota bacterium]|nr:hypothetical protein [Myxococcota bacterium]